MFNLYIEWIFVFINYSILSELNHNNDVITFIFFNSFLKCWTCRSILLFIIRVYDVYTLCIADRFQPGASKRILFIFCTYAWLSSAEVFSTSCPAEFPLSKVLIHVKRSLRSTGVQYILRIIYCTYYSRWTNGIPDSYTADLRFHCFSPSRWKWLNPSTKELQRAR